MASDHFSVKKNRTKGLANAHISKHKGKVREDTITTIFL